MRLRMRRRGGGAARNACNTAGAISAVTPSVVGDALVVAAPMPKEPARDVCEIVILSGKGGTGKTSITAAFAALAKDVILIDCDVDAADLHLVTAPAVEETNPFLAGGTACIAAPRCRGCGLCARTCQFGAISQDPENPGRWRVDPLLCEGCGVCERMCPHDAVRIKARVCGEWYRSHSRYGPMFHASLKAGAENSGKLVTLLWREARKLAEARGGGLLLTDGPPGVGCPAIATLTGADHVIFVAEPTVSGLHDLGRACQLAAGFHIPAHLVINKADICPEMAEKVREFASEHGLNVLGDVPYDAIFVQAQIAGTSVVEMGAADAGDAVRRIWDKLSTMIAVPPARA